VEKTAYIILLFLALLWLAGIVAGMIALFPLGLIGLVCLGAVGLLFATALRDRLRNKEDDYYSKHVDQ